MKKMWLVTIAHLGPIANNSHAETFEDIIACHRVHVCSDLRLATVSALELLKSDFEDEMDKVIFKSLKNAFITEMVSQDLALNTTAPGERKHLRFDLNDEFGFDCSITLSEVVVDDLI